MKAGIAYILLLAALLCPAAFTAQKKWRLRASAEEAMLNKDWYAAEQYYYKLYKLDSSGLRTKYNYAEACRLNFDIEIALKMYNRVAAVDNGNKYPLAFYWIGQVLKNQAKYKEAKKWFAKFNKLTLSQEKYGYYIRKGILEEQACDMAQLLIASPLGIESEHPGDPVNSKASEYAAFEKDSTLFFSSLRGADKSDNPQPVYNKIYRSDYRNKKWTKVKLLDTTFNNPRAHSANTCFSPDFKHMVVSRCKAKNATEFACELMISDFENNRWTAPVRMPEPINQPSVTTTQANYGIIDGKTALFFASDRPGGEGGLDIWYSLRKEDGSFDTPVNAGKNVNTADDEITPWFVSEKKTLFFSSTYHRGLGGFDIFKSAFSDNAFAEPQNAGYPINSSYNDIYYTINKAGTKIYLSSNRVGSLFEGKLNCCNDIYRFNIDTIKVKLDEPLAGKDVIPPVEQEVKRVEEQMKLLVPLTLYFHNDEPEPRTKNITTTKSYEATYLEYKKLLPAYADVYSKNLKGEARKEAVNEINTFFSDSLDAGFADLQKFCGMLQQVLLKGETVTITFKGYCSPLASTDYNINLAKRRVSSLRNYFSEVNGGWFVKYINNANANEGKIVFDEVDVGELPVSRASDDLKDKRNSVYSPAAAGERKIQILALSFAK